MLLGRILRIVARLYSLRLGLGGRCRFLLPARLLLVLDPRLRLLRLLRLGLLTLRALPPLVPAVGGNHAVVMFGVLEEIFCADPVPAESASCAKAWYFSMTWKAVPRILPSGPLLSKVEPRP